MPAGALHAGLRLDDAIERRRVGNQAAPAIEPPEAALDDGSERRSASTDEDTVGPRQSDERFRGPTSDRLHLRREMATDVLPQAVELLSVALDGVDLPARHQPGRLDRQRTRAGPDVPEHAVRWGPELGKRDRAGLGLGNLAASVAEFPLGASEADGSIPLVRRKRPSHGV